MFGRVRPPSSSPESLKMPPSKILKDDSLSIYKATLVKLKLGSQRDSSSSPTEEAVDMESDCTTASISINPVNSLNTQHSCKSSTLSLQNSVDDGATTADINCTSASDLSSFSAPQSSESSLQQHSVRDLFSKYNNARRALTSSHREALPTARDISASSSSCRSNCQSMVSTEEQSESECLGSSSVCPMQE